MRLSLAGRVPVGAPRHRRLKQGSDNPLPIGYILRWCDPSRPCQSIDAGGPGLTGALQNGSIRTVLCATARPHRATKALIYKENHFPSKLWVGGSNPPGRAIISMN